MKEKKAKKHIIIGIGALILVLAGSLGAYRVINYFATKTDKGYIKYFEICAKNTLNIGKYRIVCSISEGESTYSYADYIIGDCMYTENLIEGSNTEYSLSSWTLEDGSTYQPINANNTVVWQKYPEKYNDIANSSKTLDFELLKTYIKDMEESEEMLNLDLGNGEKSIKLYNFKIEQDDVANFLSNKLDGLKDSVFLELKAEGEFGISRLYEDYIHVSKKGYKGYNINGKLGVSDGKIVLVTITIEINSKNKIEYSKVLSYIDFKPRVKPNFEEEIVLNTKDIVGKMYK